MTAVDTSSASSRRTPGILVPTLVLAFALGLALGACSQSTGVLSIADRNAFTDQANSAIDAMNAILGEMNAGATSGDFSGVPAKVNPRLATLDGVVSTMESKSRDLKGEPKAVADQMITAAKDWRRAADSAISAGLAGDSTAYSTAIDTMNSAADRFNSLTTQWNNIGVK